MGANRKIAIGIPNKGDNEIDTLLSLLSVLSTANFDTVVIARKGPSIATNRNGICHAALKQSATHVLFIDTDMKFLSLTAHQLLELDKPVVGVASRKKKLPLEYTVEVVQPDGSQRVVTSDEMPQRPFNTISGQPITVGAGIMLIDLEKIKDVPKPWFLFTDYWEDGKEPGYSGEDDYFCRKVLDAGLEVWCDPTVYVKHIGDFEY